MSSNHEEEDPRRPQWIGWAIAIVAGCTMFGVLYIGWKIM